VKVIVYVEGPSDAEALRALLKSLIEEGRRNGIGIVFVHKGSKDGILGDVPRIAANHLRQNPDDWILALPDLHPFSDQGSHKHSSFDEMAKLLRSKFEACGKEVGLSGSALRHFRVHCLKHDLEALLLAAPAELSKRLRTKDKLRDWWRHPVEDQNGNEPPKRVVQKLFTKYLERKYVETVDAKWILERADLAAVELECKQHFKPFVQELRDIVAGREPV
jgi:hypothetical protein